MKRFVVVMLGCLILSACLDTESGQHLLTEAGQWIVEEAGPAFVFTEDGAPITTEDGSKLQFEVVVHSLVTESDEYIVTETNDATLEI